MRAGHWGWVAGLAVLALGNPAFAYVHTRTDQGKAAFWRSPCVTIVAHVANPPAGVTSDLVTAAAEAASAVWGRTANSCTDLEIRVLSSLGAPPRAVDDRSNHLILSNTGWERKRTNPAVVGYDESALALTTIWAHPDIGIIEDADIEINAVNFTWADLVASPSGEMHVADLQNSLAHEFGHFIGLDHNCTLDGDHTVRLDQNGNEVPNCKSASLEERAATMFAAVSDGDVERRTLDADDIMGVCAIYPASGAGMCTYDSGSGGCAVAGKAELSTNVTGVAFCVFALALGGWRLRASRRRRD